MQHRSKLVTTTGYVTHNAFLEHDTGSGHAERSARIAGLQPHLERSGIFAELQRVVATEAPLEKLRRVHDENYVAEVKRRIERGDMLLDAGDTAVSSGSWRAALLAAGGALDATDRVMRGEWDNAFLAARPPGHHAEHDHAMGFCLFNNIAVAAQHLLDEHKLERVAILDWDVHHGNGTQHAFEHDPRVLFVSLHQYPHYPGTGSSTERGLGAGEGATLNLPLEAGSTDRDYLKIFEERALPALDEFAPEFLLISAGFDAHERDPLAGMRVTEAGFAAMTASAVQLAKQHCDGRVVSLLEGGYDLEALQNSVEVHLAGLLQT